MLTINRIQLARELLNETQEEFGKRFNKTAMAISYYEKGKRRAPYDLLDFCLETTRLYVKCSNCKGKGYLKALE